MEPPGAALRNPLPRHKSGNRWSVKEASENKSRIRMERLGWPMRKSTSNISRPDVKPEMVKHLTDLFQGRASKEDLSSKSVLKLLKELGEDEGENSIADE